MRKDLVFVLHGVLNFVTYLYAFDIADRTYILLVGRENRDFSEACP